MHKRLLAAIGAMVVPVSAGLIAVTPGTALADDPVSIVRSTSPLETADTLNGLTFLHQVGQTDTNPETGSAAIVDGPGTPPLGTGSLKLSTGSNGDTGVALFDQSYLNYYFTPDFSTVVPFPVAYNPAALKLKFGYFDTASDLPAKVMITLWRGAVPINFEAVLATGADWQTFDIADAQLLEVGGDGVTTHTLTEWAQPGDSIFAVFVGADYNDTNANPNKSFYLDNLTYGFAVSLGFPSVHPPTTYDFETAASGPVVTAGPGSTIKAGKSATLTVTVTDGGNPVVGHVQLWAKSFGDSDFSRVATMDTNATGHASSTQSPLHNTAYMWRYLGTDANPEVPGDDSATRTVNVKDVVTAYAADPDLSTSQKLKISGATMPAKAGVELTVYRIKSGHKSPFDVVETAADGSYSYSHAPLKKGSYKFAVGVPAASGNAAGISKTVSVDVG